MKHSTRYSHQYSPPAPLLPVTLAMPDESSKFDSVLALVDTGADGTFVPTTWLEDLEAPIVYMTNVRSHLGEKLLRASVYKVDLIFFGELRLPVVEVVADDWGEHIILGRNVLNRLKLLLDGPEQMINLT